MSNEIFFKNIYFLLIRLKKKFAMIDGKKLKQTQLTYPEVRTGIAVGEFVETYSYAPIFIIHVSRFK